MILCVSASRPPDLTIVEVSGPIFGSRQSESLKITDDIWQLCIFFGSDAYCNQFLKNLFEALKKSGWLVNGSFKGENSYLCSICQKWTFQGRFFLTPIKQIRGFVGLILQPEMKPPKIVPDTRINTKRDESSQTHLTVFTTLRSFRDKCVSA